MKCQFYDNLLNYIRFFSEDLYTFKNNSLFCDKYKYQPLIGLLYFLSMSEHLKPKQALFCSNASQGGLPGEGCWTMTRVLDWTPLPQLLSQLDHSDHAESWQSTTAKNNHTWWITWELTHLSKICKKSAIWLLGTIPLDLEQRSDDLDLQIKIVIGRSLFDLIGDHFLPFF